MDPSNPGPLLVHGVALAIRKVKSWSPTQRTAEAERCADIIACGADTLSGNDRSPVTAYEVRAAVRTGLAILAYRPGGVGFGGLHWHADEARCVECPGTGAWELPDTPDTDRGRGAVFTPRSLAEDVVRNALAVLVQRPSLSPPGDIVALRVIDPWCGSGAMLLAAARYLADALVASWEPVDATEINNLKTLYGTDDQLQVARARVLGGCLYGVDLDPLSVELCGLALQLLAPAAQVDHRLDVDEDDYAWWVATAQPELRARLVRPAAARSARLPGLRVGDSLTGRVHRTGPLVDDLPGALDWPDQFPDVIPAAETGGFDAVIGNPPYLGGNRIVSELGADYRARLAASLTPGRRPNVDLAVYCHLRAHQLVDSYGIVAIIGPANLLGGTNAVGLQRLAKAGWQPYRIVRNLPWPTTRAAVSVCLVWTHRHAEPPDDVRTEPPSLPGPHVDVVVSRVGDEIHVTRLGPPPVTRVHGPYPIDPPAVANDAAPAGHPQEGLHSDA